MQKVTVVLPTFNEAENIVSTVRNILLQDIPGLDIIVADDDSKDGTLQKVSEYFSGDSRIRCYKHPPPRGLSPSVADAFDLCDSAILCCMDADGQHRAEDLRKIVERFNDTSVNMVIGSRYVKNGGFAEKWRFFALFVNKFCLNYFINMNIIDMMFFVCAKFVQNVFSSKTGNIKAVLCNCF